MIYDLSYRKKNERYNIFKERYDKFCKKLCEGYSFYDIDFSNKNNLRSILIEFFNHTTGLQNFEVFKMLIDSQLHTILEEAEIHQFLFIQIKKSIINDKGGYLESGLIDCEDELQNIGIEEYEKDEVDYNEEIIDLLLSLPKLNVSQYNNIILFHLVKNNYTGLLLEKIVKHSSFVLPENLFDEIINVKIINCPIDNEVYNCYVSVLKYYYEKKYNLKMI